MAALASASCSCHAAEVVAMIGATPPSRPGLPTCATPTKLELSTPVQVDIETLWEEARICEEEAILHCAHVDEDLSDDDAEYRDEMEGACAALVFCAPRRARAVMVKLPCGDIHLCGGGHACPYLEPNADRILCCRYTGIEYHAENTEEFFDLNGGSGKKSNDPDQSCGELHHGRYTKKADPLAASRAAYVASEGFSDTALSTFIPSEASKAAAARQPCKRGALCVGETASCQGTKRIRASKKNVRSREMCTNLQLEAEAVLGKLINYSRASSFRQKGDRVERGCAPATPLMCDEKSIFADSVKRYVRASLFNGTAPSLDAINNLALMAQQASARARAEASMNTGDALRTAKFRTYCSGIIVALWSAACKTEYMKNAKRGSDAYRPFCCGVLYATKRGVALADGTVVVPKCPQLAAALPVLRGTGGNAIAKTLHSSSHRGLCTLSRCIASVPPNEQKRAFADVILLAKRFAEQTFSPRDV